MKNGYNNFGGGGYQIRGRRGPRCKTMHIHRQLCCRLRRGPRQRRGYIDQNGRADIEGCTFLSNNNVNRKPSRESTKAPCSRTTRARVEEGRVEKNCTAAIFTGCRDVQWLTAAPCRSCRFPASSASGASALQSRPASPRRLTMGLARNSSTSAAVESALPPAQACR